jgi:hypothetical protein
MVRLPVYCCCDPSLFLGTIDWPSDVLVEGQRRTFALQRLLTFNPFVSAPPAPLARVELEVATHSGPGGRKFAVKSNDVPIEDLVEIPGFRIAKGNEF